MTSCSEQIRHSTTDCATFRQPTSPRSSSEVGLHARRARPVAGGVNAPMCPSCRFRTSRATGQNARQTPSNNARRSRRRAWFPRQDRCRRGRLTCRTRIISSACGAQRFERGERIIRIADLHVGKQVEALNQVSCQVRPTSFRRDPERDAIEAVQLDHCGTNCPDNQSCLRGRMIPYCSSRRISAPRDMPSCLAARL